MARAAAQKSEVPELFRGCWLVAGCSCRLVLVVHNRMPCWCDEAAFKSTTLDASHSQQEIGVWNDVERYYLWRAPKVGKCHDALRLLHIYTVGHRIQCFPGR